MGSNESPKKPRWREVLEGVGLISQKSNAEIYKHDHKAEINRLKARMLQELQKQPDTRTPSPSVRQIRLDLEILPFEFASRSPDPVENGRLWQHVGDDVIFQLCIPHDKLDIYSVDGTYIKSYPITSSGHVKIKGLEVGVYRLFLYGRKICDMESLVSPSDTSID